VADSNQTDLPPIPTSYDGSGGGALARLREAVQVLRGNRGDSLDKAITWRDAIANGLAIIKRSTGTVGIGSGGYGPPPGDPPDLTPPPTPTGLAASAAISHVIVTFDAPTYTQGHGNQRTDIYAVQRDADDTSPPPVFADAAVVTSAAGASPIVAISSNPHTKWYVWAKFVTVDGVASVSPAGGTNGVQCTTGQDVQTLLDALTAAAFNPASPYTVLALRADLFTLTPTVDFYQTSTPTATATGDLWLNPSTGVFKVWDGAAWVVFPVHPPFFVTTVPIVQNGVTCPPGVYITDAYVANGTITNAMIGNLVVDDAKIADLSVAKLTAGSLAVGEYIQSTGYVAGSSGWKIGGNGVAEFSGVIVRGTLYASAGDIGGADIGTTYVESPGFNATTHVGWQLNSSTGKITAASLLITDSTGTRILNTDATGTGVVLQIGSALQILANGNASFGGTLTAANVVGTTQIQAGAVTVGDTATNFASLYVADTTDNTLWSATETVAGGGFVRIDLIVPFNVQAAGSYTVTFKLWRDASVIWSQAATWSGISGDISPYTALLIDHPAGGSRVYKLTISISGMGGGDQVLVYPSTFFYMEFKR